ncbi:MAG: ABC transporter ATP-binding protein [Myxococcales bacterium]|nr:ABC transporter ATP-binding protein [Myxococcales bacterium]
MSLPSTRDPFVERLRDLIGLPTHSPLPAATPEALVERSADLDMPDVVEEGTDPPPPGPVDMLVTRLARRGIALQRFDAPVSVVCSELRTGRPVAALDRSGSVVLLLERVARLVRVEDEDGSRAWLDPDALADRLGHASAAAEHTWLAVDSPTAFVLPTSEHPSVWRMVSDLLRADRSDLLAIAVYAMGVGVLSLVLPLTVQVLVNTVAFGTLLQPIVVLTLMLAAGLVFAACLQGLQAFMAEVVQRRLFVRVVSELATRLPRLHVDALDQRHGPELLNRFFDVFVAQKALASLAIGGIEAALATFAGLLLLAFYHPVLLAFGGLIILGVAIVLRVLGRGGTRTAIDESKAKYAVAAWLEDMAAQRITLKLAGGAEFAQRRLDRLAAAWLGARDAHFRVVFRQYVGTLGLQVITSAALLGIGGWLVIQRELTIGQLVAAELVVGAVVASLNKLGTKLETAYDLAASADKLHVLLDQPLEREGGAATLRGRGRGRGPAALELSTVSSADGLLDGLSLRVAPGRRLRVSGDERRTDVLVDVLFGLRAPSAGAVLLDGEDLRDVSLRALRQRVAVVDGAEVLPTTIAENVSAVGRAISAREIWETLERVGLAEHVRALPDGLQTVLTPSGTPLTRTDALRLTVARALAAQPGLLVLDRTLDALPPSLGHALLDALGREQTLVVVSHSDGFDAHVDAHLTLTEDSP